MVGRRSWGSESGRVTPGGLDLAGRRSRRTGSGEETVPEVRKWAGDYPSGPEVVARPAQRSESSLDSFPEVRK